MTHNTMASVLRMLICSHLKIKRVSEYDEFNLEYENRLYVLADIFAAKGILDLERIWLSDKRKVVLDYFFGKITLEKLWDGAMWREL